MRAPFRPSTASEVPAKYFQILPERPSRARFYALHLGCGESAAARHSAHVSPHTITWLLVALGPLPSLSPESRPLFGCELRGALRPVMRTWSCSAMAHSALTHCGHPEEALCRSGGWYLSL